MSSNDKLDRADIIKLCNELGFDKQSYRLSYGSALVMHGVRQFAHDIDMDVSGDLFEELSHNYPLKYKRDGERYICIDDIVDVFATDSLAEDTEFIDGIPVAGLEHVREAKRRLGRDKDMEDIKLIEEFMAARSKNNRS